MSIQYDGPAGKCGNRGCLELYCSTISVQKKVKELLPEYPRSGCTANGISGQMHGLLCLGRDGKVLRPAVLHCDQRSQREI